MGNVNEGEMGGKDGDDWNVVRLDMELGNNSGKED